MSSLYEIDGALLAMLEHGFTVDCIDLETGEIDEAKAQEFLTNLPIEREKKLEAYGCLIKNLTAEAEAIRAEEKALAARRQQKEKTVERLKENVSASMQAFNELKYETAKVVFSFRKSESVEVNEAALAEFAQRNNRDDLLTYKAPTANKTAIKAALKAGEAIEGASLVIKQNLQIK